jgi:hypothetical protein
MVYQKEWYTRKNGIPERLVYQKHCIHGRIVTRKNYVPVTRMNDIPERMVYQKEWFTRNIIYLEEWCTRKNYVPVTRMNSIPEGMVYQKHCIPGGMVYRYQKE